MTVAFAGVFLLTLLAKITKISEVSDFPEGLGWGSNDHANQPAREG